MDYADLYSRFERLVESSRVGILTTVDESGFPRSRWMTPTFLRGRPGCLYAITAPDSFKAAGLRSHPRVEWFFQSKSLDLVFSALGEANLIDDPQAKAEVQEAIGPNLQIFWRVNPNAKNLTVVETVIGELNCFYPMRNERYRAVRG